MPSFIYHLPLLAVLLALTTTTTACPTSYSVDCISWSEEGGQCQALHAVVRVRDDFGQPVNGANVQVTANRKISGGKQHGKVVRATSSTLSSNYQGEVDLMCPADPFPYSGTTAAFCWQQAVVGSPPYVLTVVNIDWPDCPNAIWIPNTVQDTATYTFTGTACSP